MALDKGDRRRALIIEDFLQALSRDGWKPGPSALNSIVTAADQIQSAADLLFHGSITAMDEEIPQVFGDHVCRFAAELIVAEMLDHGLCLRNLQGDMINVPSVVEKAGGTITTSWPDAARGVTPPSSPVERRTGERRIRRGKFDDRAAEPVRNGKMPDRRASATGSEKE